jgi:phosphohistidine phosphatase
MQLVLWRHADAEDGPDDLARKLTPKGRKQAARMAEWLDRNLPEQALVLVSPALRARETAKALERRQRIETAIAPGARAADVLEAAGWPDARGTMVIVGHQPSIGQAAALALTGAAHDWRVKKGAVWWIELEEGESAPAVRAVLSPDMV